MLDEALVTPFSAPRSYTGEDVVEVGLHGNPVLVAELLRLAVDAGARLAEPGEFTRRAFESGRLDLTRAEAVLEVVSAEPIPDYGSNAAHALGGRAWSTPVWLETADWVAG